jgi:hypothetical protein
MLTLALLAAGAINPAMTFPSTIGESCQAAYLAERSRGGKPKVYEQAIPTDSESFDGKYGGENAFISYNCHDGKIHEHSIVVDFSKEAPARAYFRSQRKVLDDALGSPQRVYECLSASSKKRLGDADPDLVKNLQNTYMWKMKGGTYVLANVEYEDGEWSVTFHAMRTAELCDA